MNDRPQLIGNRLALAGTVLYFMEWIGIVVAPSLPTDKLGRDASSVVASYSDHPGRTAFLAGWLSIVLLGRVLFYSGLRQAFRDSGRPSALVDFALVAMGVSVAIEIASYYLVAAGAWLAGRHAESSGILTLDAAGAVLFYGVLGTAAVSVFAGSLWMLASRLFPRWLSWLGLAAGGLLILGAIFGTAGQGLTGALHDVGGVLTSVPVLGFWVWMIATSIVLFRRTPSAVTSS